MYRDVHVASDVDAVRAMVMYSMDVKLVWVRNMAAATVVMGMRCVMCCVDADKAVTVKVEFINLK